jgi:hypothetical protein
MKTHTPAVVIGGGILECSMLYYLTGTAGATWCWRRREI